MLLNSYEGKRLFPPWAVPADLLRGNLTSTGRIYHLENYAVRPAQFAVPRRIWLHVALLLIPLAVYVLSIRLIEFSILQRSTAVAISPLLWSNAPLPILLLLMMALLFFWSRNALPRLPRMELLTGLACTTALVFLAAATFSPYWLTEWMHYPAFLYIHHDLQFLLALCILSLILLSITRRPYRSLLLGALCGIVLLLYTVTTMTFGYFLTTGSPGDWYLVQYFLQQAGDLTLLVSSEMTTGRMLLLLLPIILVALPFVVERLKGVQRWMAHPLPANARTPWLLPVYALPLLLLLLSPTIPGNNTEASFHATSSIPALLTGATQNLLDTRAPQELQRTGPLFDTADLRLIATDSTRLLNLVFVILESARSRSFTPYTPALDTTPFLDSLANQALLIDQMFTVISHTNKSLTAMFAGIYPRLSRDIIESKPGGIPGPGLPTLLKPFGYASAFFTPATMAYEQKDQLLTNLGFETIRGDGDYPTKGFAKKDYFGYEDRIMLQPSLAWVDSIGHANKPFVLSYLTLSSHHPYDTPPDYPLKPYAEDDPHLTAYYNALRYTDAFLKDLFAAFQQRGLYDSTLFVVVGDHGEAFGEHLQRTHGDVIWDEALHVPALIFQPTLFPEGRRISGPRQHLDWLPTVAEVLGMTLEQGSYPGQSLLAPVPTDRTLLHSNWNGRLGLALRRDSLKFVYYHRRRPTQVFNIHKDPLEKHNLAQLIPDHTRKAAELELSLWHQQVEQLYLPIASR